jgi:hypothetical protein
MPMARRGVRHSADAAGGAGARSACPRAAGVRGPRPATAPLCTSGLVFLDANALEIEFDRSGYSHFCCQHLSPALEIELEQERILSLLLSALESWLHIS